MRRDYFDLDVRNVDWADDGGDPRKPTVHIRFQGPQEMLKERLTGSEGELLEADETDVAFRLREPLDGSDAAGVVGVANRVTGDFILELNREAGDVLQFIRAAHEYGQHAGEDDACYRIEISIDDEPVVAYEKSTFLVYDHEGKLLRHESLIPSGVEL